MHGLAPAFSGGYRNWRSADGFYKTPNLYEIGQIREKIARRVDKHSAR